MSAYPLYKLSDWMLIFVFIAILWLPLAENYWHWDPIPVANENRKLTPPPQWKWDLKSLRRFPSNWEAYYNDHFGWRNSLLQMHSRLIVLGLKQSLSEYIVIGKEGWLYTANDGTLQDYQGLLPLTPGELSFFRETLEQRRDWLAKRNCRFLFILTPDKQSIYPEYLPTYLKNKAGRTRADQLIDYLKKNSDIDVIDARALLKNKKSLGRLFYLTDTHWNDLGAWVIYHQLANYLRKDFPLIPSAELDQFRQQVLPFQGDLALVLGLSQNLSEQAVQLNTFSPRKNVEIRHPIFRMTETQNSSLPRVLVHRDSFFNALIPLTSEIFQKAVYIWDYTLNTKVFDEEKPNLVVLEMVERMIPRLSPNPPTLRANSLREDFHNSKTICLTVSTTQLPKKIKTKELEISAQNSSWLLKPLSARAQWILPEFKFPTNQALAVSIKITAPNKSKLSLLYKTKTDPKYRTWRQVSSRLQPGFNECLFYLNHPLMADRLRLDFTDTDKPYQLHAIEIRAVSPD